jgi:chromosome partitioning protein
LPAKKKRTPVLAVLNMKGGVGKTTISANLLRTLYAREHIDGLLVDLDPQFNLTQSLLSEADHDGLLRENRSVLSAMERPGRVELFDVALTESPPPAPADLVHTLRESQRGGTSVRLDILAGDFALVKYSFIGDPFKLTAVQNRFLQFVQDAADEYGVLCIDCNPSSSFITSCAIHACTHLVVPVRSDRYSLRGLELLVRLLEELPTKYPKPDLLIVLNGVDGAKGPSGVETELRASPTFGKKTLVSRLRESEFLRALPYGVGFAIERGGPHRGRLEDDLNLLSDEVAVRVGIK